MGSPKYFSVEEIKVMRVSVDAMIQNLAFEKQTHEATGTENRVYDFAVYQAEIKLIEAKMWLGKMLEGLGNPFPANLADKAK